jgi:hypothetical protein
MFFYAERPDVGKAAPVKAEAEVHGKGQELPERCEVWRLSPAGHEKVKCEYYKICRKDAVGAPTVKLRN